jgi:hypothetical protein
MAGIIEPGIPRVMQRSYKLKSSGLLNGPFPKLLAKRRGGLCRASVVRGGRRPSAGSTSSQARLFLAPKSSNQ